MNYEELLVSNLALVDKLVAFVCRRHALYGADAEDFASLVKLKLVENDYAILRKFEGKSSLATYLGVVVQRIFLSHRTRQWGKWSPSPQAAHAGDAAVLLEAMVHRDGIAADEALPRVLKRYPEASPDTLGALLARLAPRVPARPRVYNFAGEPPEVVSKLTPDGDLAQKERESIGARATRTLRTTIQGWPVQDQLIVRMRYADGLKVATIARLLQLELKSLYRHIDRLLRGLRVALAADGLPLEDLRSLLEAGPAALDFEFEELARSEYSPEGVSKEEREESAPAYGERETA